MRKTGQSRTDDRGNIVIYTAKGGRAKLEVKLDKQTIWLTQKEMSELFSTDRSVITKHLHNIFKSKELDDKSVCAFFAHTAADGKTYQTKFYNLDVVICVGYRVNSKRATQFRIWATKVLKDYLVKGYALNQKRLIDTQAERLKELQETINFIRTKADYPVLIGKANDLLNIINDYANALTILYQYDSQLLVVSAKKKPRFHIKYEHAKELIDQVKVRLQEKGETTDLFGQEVGHKFQGIVNGLYQTFDSKELYSSVEEKAAHLLYFTIKDHPFSDGNKRIASLVFIYYLEKNGYLCKANGERKINDNAIIALSLLIATSDPKEKDVMIKLITNLLKG